MPIGLGLLIVHLINLDELGAANEIQKVAVPRTQDLYLPFRLSPQLAPRLKFGSRKWDVFAQRAHAKSASCGGERLTLTVATMSLLFYFGIGEIPG